MAGASSFNGKSLGLVSVPVLGFGLSGFGLSGLRLGLGLRRGGVSLNGLGGLGLGSLGLSLGRNLFRLRRRLWCGLLGGSIRSARPTRTLGFRGHRLLLHQLD